MNHKTLFGNVIFTCLACALGAATIQAAERNILVAQKSIEGIAVTGDNNRFQEPIWYLSDVLGTAFFNWIFVYNPDGDKPFFMTRDMPEDSVLAGGVDPLAQALGLAPEFVDPTMINVPVHQTPITVGQFGRGVGTGNRAQVPSALEYPGGAASTRSAPNKPVTIKSWFKAKGDASVKCYADNTAKVSIKLKNLIKNGVYTLWTIYQVDTDGDGADDGVAPYAFGGVPNVFTPNAEGRARVTREVGYCPLNEEKLLFIDVAWHSDGNVYGGVPDQPFDGFAQPMGTVTHTQLQFPFNVTPLH